MLHGIPEFDLHYVAYLKDDPAKETIATSYSAPGLLAEAAHKTGRAKADFEIQQITKQEHDRLKAALLGLSQAAVADSRAWERPNPKESRSRTTIR